jgi:hypothetical protein
MPQRVAFTPSNPHYRMTTTLAGVQLILDVRWNGRDAAWYLDVYAEDDVETPIAHGIKLLLGTSPLARSISPLIPAGIWTVEDLSQEGRDATLDDLGERVVVRFYGVDELIEAGVLP